MNGAKKEDHRTKAQLLEEIQELRRRLEEAEQTLEAIRTGDVDALVVAGAQEERIYTLAGAEHVYRMVVETMNEAALMVDPDGTVLFSNQRFCDLMKVPMHKVLGRKVTAFAARPQQPPLEELLAQAQAGPVQRRVTLRAADGAAVPAQISASLLTVNGSASVCLVASDLTELEASANSIRVLREHQQALEESESRFRTIFEASRDAVVITDDEGVYLQANPAVASVLGLPPEKLIGRRVFDFMVETIDFPAIWRQFLTTGSFRGEMPLIDADGQMRYVDAYAVANILPGRHLCVIRDVTERKRARDDLEWANTQLQVQAEELETQTEELRVANDELRLSQQALQEANEQLQERAAELRLTNEELRVTNEELAARERELGHQRELLATVLNTMPVGVVFVDARGNFTYSNPHVSRIFGQRVSGDAFGPAPNTYYITKPDHSAFPSEELPLVRAVRERTSVTDVEMLIRRADGSEVAVLVDCAPVSDDRGRITGAVASLTDVTERKRAEGALRESEERLRLAQQAARIGAFEWSIQTGVNRWTPELEAMYGLPPGSFAGTQQAWEQLVHPEDREEALRRVAQAFETGAPAEGEWRVIWPDGSIHWLAGRWQVFRDESGDPLRMTGINIDITERKQAEEALRESEQRYHRLFEDDLTGNFIATTDGQILLCNPAFAKTFGFSHAQDAVGTNMLDLYIDPRERQPLMERLKQECKMERLEVWRKRRDGGPIYVVENLIGHFNERGELYEIKGYVFDDTERKQAEEALRESEQRYRTLGETIPYGVWLTDASGYCTYVSDSFLELVGMTMEQVQQFGWLHLLPPNDVEPTREYWLRCVATGEPFEREHRFRAKEGGYRHVLAIGRPIRNERGQIISWAGINLDITERKRTEEEVRRQRELLQAIVDNIPVFLVLWDGQLREFQFNEEFRRVLGWTEADAADGDFMAKVYPDPDYRREVEQYMQSLQPGWRDLRTTAKDGSAVDVSWANVPLSGNRSIGIGVDIRERKRAEEALREFTRTLETRVAQRTAELQHRARQLQKLTLELSQAEESERKHLAEVLHDDLQQQLAAAKFHLQMLSNRLRYNPSQQAIAAKVDGMLKEAVEKSRSLSHELSPAVLYHGNLVETFRWLASQVHAKHGLIVHVDALHDVAVQSDALKAFLYKAGQELLFNVVKHARVSEARMRLRRVGHCVCLSVSDRGRGFDPQELKQTSGFGLFSIRERVELLGGRMKIKSVKGQGSAFHIVVPDDGASLGPRPASLVTTPRRETGDALPVLRVLLADDHQIVREGLVSLLAEMPGIEVVGEAANGREAINLASRLRPDVVIMDVTMPLINGDEATRQIKMHLPGTRVIALSMYDDADLIEKMQQAGAEGYVLKTAPSEELLAAIRGR